MSTNDTRNHQVISSENCQFLAHRSQLAGPLGNSGVTHLSDLARFLRALGCIARWREAKLIRRGLPEIWDQNLGKLRRKPPTCGGRATEAPEPVFPVHEAGPASARCE